MPLLSKLLKKSHIDKAETGQKKTTGYRLKRFRRAEIESVLISSPFGVPSPWSEVQSLRGPTFACSYYTPEDIGRVTLRITNPDASSASSGATSSTLGIATNAHAAASIENIDDSMIAELQSLPGYHGPEARSETSETLVSEGTDELHRPFQEDRPNTSKNRPLNPLQANPPSLFLDSQSISWLNLNASNEEVALHSDFIPPTEVEGPPTASRSECFNPVTEEDCPPSALPPMHGPGSRYAMYSQPETFRTSSEQLRSDSTAQAAGQDPRSGVLQQSRPRRRLPVPSQHPRPEVISADILPFSSHRQPPTDADPDTKKETNPFGHYVYEDELCLSQSTTVPVARFAEATEVHRKSNRERLKERTKNVLESLVPATAPSSGVRRRVRRHRNLEDLHSYKTEYRPPTNPVNRWDDYAVVESSPQAASRSAHSFPSFSTFRLTLSRVLRTATAAEEVLRENGYFAARHHKRQEFLRCTCTRLSKKKLQIEAATQYLNGALDDLGSFEVDFSSFGVQV